MIEILFSYGNLYHDQSCSYLDSHVWETFSLIFSKSIIFLELLAVFWTQSIIFLSIWSLITCLHRLLVESIDALLVVSNILLT